VGEAPESPRTPGSDFPPVPPDVSASRGGRAAIARTLSTATRAVVSRTNRIFGDLAEQGEQAVREFQARPEHSRWRAYALGSYGLIVVATLVFQFYDRNPLGARVEVKHVDLPRSTLIQVRNDSTKPWKNVKLRLNGHWDYTQDLVPSGGILMPDVRDFMFVDEAGVPNHASESLDLRTLHIDSDRGSFDKELKQ
jgi:hypothetical protein